MNEQPVKRPIGLTILLVLSLVNACLQILSNLGLYVTTPVMSQMLADGTLEKTMTPFLSVLQMSDDDLAAFWQIVEGRLVINPISYLLTALLYVGSLIGVIRMFKLQRVGFHFYSISQMLILIVSVIYVYAKMGSVGFFNDFLMTAMFILLYHLYLKRIENDPEAKREPDL